MKGVETNDIEVISDIEISAIPVVIDATNSAMPNTLTVDVKSDNENNLGQIKRSSDHEYPLIKNEQPSSGKKKITPALHLSTIAMASYIREEQLKHKEEVLKLKAERDYFIYKKVEKRNASIKEKILLLKESLF